jgi:hypothetical protein
MNTYGHATERMQKDATATLESVLSSCWLHGWLSCETHKTAMRRKPCHYQ